MEFLSPAPPRCGGIFFASFSKTHGDKLVITMNFLKMVGPSLTCGGENDIMTIGKTIHAWSSLQFSEEDPDHTDICPFDFLKGVGEQREESDGQEEDAVVGGLSSDDDFDDSSP